MSPDSGTARSRGGAGRQIADAVVRLHREHTGRGPVSARVIIEGDTVVVLLREVLTKAEQTLVDAGRADEVLAFRRGLQDVLRPAFVAEVQEAMGREVDMFMSTNNADPGHSAEIFLLER